jgi:cyclopropane fatty-acyl-phospholipid synthase-like methyltransferase
LFSDTPWDTGTTPPELLEFLGHTQPDRALDLGCGTGTNAITMAEHGWDVVGVDFSALAIWAARRKAKGYGDKLRFLKQDVTDLSNLTRPFGLCLDIGCFHGLNPTDRPDYASDVIRLTKPDGAYLLYTFLPQETEEDRDWPTEGEIRGLFEGSFTLLSLTYGEDQDYTSAWFRFQRRIA